MGRALPGHRISAGLIVGSRCQLGLPVSEQDADPVVGEGSEPEADALDPFDEVVGGFGWAVVEGAAAGADFGGVGGVGEVMDDLVEVGAG